MTTVTRKIGTNRGKRRLWLEGRVLADAGFAPGDKYVRMPSPRTALLVLALVTPPTTAKQYTVSGKGSKPIIDIIGGDIVNVFGADVATVTVTRTEGVPGMLLVRRES
jgi:hypothetical protein